ncbi:MAG: ATP-binding cassette domain-containing protein [Anaerolineae bacterium]
MNTKTAIQVTNLTKRYRRKTAVEDITFEVRRGEILGLLGPNGAGKSTIIKILCGLASPTSGSASVNGFDCHRQSVEAHHSLGYVPEVVNIYGEMTATQFLQYSARFYDMSPDERSHRVGEVLEQVGLTSAADIRVRTYSRGMRQRLALASALVHSPEVLILDEPTTGLDPIGTRDLRDLIRSLRGRTTVLFSSHNLHEAEALCDRVAVLNQGRLMALGSLDDLLRGHKLVVRMRLRHTPDGLPQALDQEGLVAGLEVNGNELTFQVKDKAARPMILRRAVELGAEVYEMTTDVASLEEVFSRLLEEGVPR